MLDALRFDGVFTTIASLLVLFFIAVYFYPIFAVVRNVWAGLVAWFLVFELHHRYIVCRQYYVRRRTKVFRRLANQCESCGEDSPEHLRFCPRIQEIPGPITWGKIVWKIRKATGFYPRGYTPPGIE